MSPPRRYRHAAAAQPEKAVEAHIIDLFRKCGLKVWKTSQPRASMITEGLPDLWVFCKRRAIGFWFEVKTTEAMKKPHNGMSLEQRQFRELCLACGVRHYVGDFDVARQLLDELEITLKPEPLPLPAFRMSVPGSFTDTTD